jgi:tetraacyldisaccharide 4'-kinase
MSQHFLLKILLAPLSLLYGLIIGARNVLYDSGLLKSSSFNIPIIGVGNLSMGGSGKTPHVEYLLNLLKPYLNVGVLSRGYMRKSSGYKEVTRQHTVDDVGDEPLQYKLKYNDVVVSVSEQRAIGIPLMIGDYPSLQTIILDDAFQHRAITPSLNILLTDYKFPYIKDHLIPSGRLREGRSAASRADLIIVSKCPADISIEEREEWRKKLTKHQDVQVYFSTYEYGTPYFMYDAKKKITLDLDTQAILLSGIAKPIYLEEYVSSKVGFINIHSYEDHHNFKPHEVSLIHRAFQELDGDKKVVITTEKDSTRLDKHREFLQKHNIPIYILPIKVKFIEEEGHSFDNFVKDFLLNFKT